MTKIIAFVLLIFVFSECATPRQVRQVQRKKNCPPYLFYNNNKAKNQ